MIYIVFSAIKPFGLEAVAGGRNIFMSSLRREAKRFIFMAVFTFPEPEWT
jgi:hypothetical protein